MSMLPTQKTKPSHKLADLTVFIYGPPKIGKSTFCSQAENALFIPTEDGLKHLEVFSTPVVRSWTQFVDIVKEIAAGKHNFRTVVIDTVDNLYLRCAEHVCQRKQVEHEDDIGDGYGKGKGLVNREFSRVLTWLQAHPYGLYMTSHSKTIEIKTKGSKDKIVKVQPTLGGAALTVSTAMSDVLAYCDVDDRNQAKRVMHTRPSFHHVAGDRTKLLPPVLAFDYAAFASHFDAAPTERVAPNLPPPSQVDGEPATEPRTTAAPAHRPAQPPASNGANGAVISDAQTKRLWAIKTELGLKNDDVKSVLASLGIVDANGQPTTKVLPKARYDEVERKLREVAGFKEAEKLGGDQAALPLEPGSDADDGYAASLVSGGGP